MDIKTLARFAALDKETQEALTKLALAVGRDFKIEGFCWSWDRDEEGYEQAPIYINMDFEDEQDFDLTDLVNLTKSFRTARISTEENGKAYLSISTPVMRGVDWWRKCSMDHPTDDMVKSLGIKYGPKEYMINQYIEAIKKKYQGNS